MKEKLKCGVHLVDTDKPSLILLCHNDYLQFDSDNGKGYVQNCIDYKNLYFTSNEEIKEGEIGINTTTGSIFRLLKKNEADVNNTYPWWDVEWITGGNISNSILITSDFHVEPRKIVATANPELWYKGPFNEKLQRKTFGDIPCISQDFIEAFIKAWNKNEPIKEVYLETIYLGKDGCQFDNHEEYTKSQLGCKIYGGECNCNLKQLKLRSDGSVIVHPVKETMISLKEALVIAQRAFYHQIGTLPYDTISFSEWKREFFDKNYPINNNN